MKSHKYQKIIEDLKKAIRRGDYRAGDQLPTERELSEKYAVARNTARRALTDLEEMGLAVRRGRRGTIILPGVSGGKVDTLNLVCTAEPLPSVESFLRHGIRVADAMNSRIKITRVSSRDEITTLRALSLGSKHLIFAEGMDVSPEDKITSRIVSVSDRAVLIGSRLDNMGVRSVICDDTLGINLAIQHLQNHGHRKIAIFCGAEPKSHPILNLMLNTWKKKLALSMSRQDFSDCEIHIPHESFQDLMIDSYKVTKPFLMSKKAENVTAIITLSKDIADGVAAACRDCGLKIPKNISLLDYAITDRSAFADPPRTGISVQIDKHVERAIKLLEKSPESKLLHQIKPVLVEGKSVGHPQK